MYRKQVGARGAFWVEDGEKESGGNDRSLGCWAVRAATRTPRARMMQVNTDQKVLLFIGALLAVAIVMAAVVLRTTW